MLRYQNSMFSSSPVAVEALVAQWRTQGSAWSNFPPNIYGAPLKWHPSDTGAPYFGVYWSRNRNFKISKLNNALHCVEPQDLRVGFWLRLFPYRLGSTMLFFRNSNTVPLSLGRVRTAQQAAVTNGIAFASTVLDLPVGCAKLVCFCYDFIFNAWWQPRTENSENRTTINMENL